MLKIKGNKEFVAWWEHWMSRIHPKQVSGTPMKSGEQQGTRNKDCERSSEKPETKVRGAHFSSVTGETRSA